MKRSILLLLLMFLVLAPAARAQTDGDGDGVVDGIDLCPNQDASFFDADGDGCPDPTAHARQIEYWAAADLPLVYVIHENGAPGISDGSDIAAIVAGFDAWSAVAGVSLASTYAGPTTQSAGSGLDGINLVSFEDPDFVALFGNAVIAVGVSTSFESPSEFQGNPVRPGQIVDADMLFNPNRTFSTDGSGVDLRSVATHEAGHVFGLNHSALPVATMFPALPSGIQARSLETDDQLLAFMSYPEAGALAAATVVRGSVRSGTDASAVPGAAVFAIPVGSDDAIAVQFTLPDGSWSFAGLPEGSYHFYVHPLDGSAGVSGVVPGYINSLVVATAITLFLPEFYDAAESSDDDATAKTPVTLAGGVTVSDIDVITNVDARPPQVLAVTPEDDADEVNSDGVILVKFDEALDFDSVPSRFALEKVEGMTRTGVAGQLVALGARDVLVFTPSARLDFDADYELTLESGILDRFGNPMPADFVTGFTVQAKPRLNAISIEPMFVVPGTVAVIAGEGFDHTNAANNFVDFGGVIAAAFSASYNRLAVIVPDGIPAGTFSVLVSTASETSATLLEAQRAEVVDFPRGSPIAAFDLQGEPRVITALPSALWTIAATSFGVEGVLVDASSSRFGTTIARDITGGIDDLAIVPGGRRAYGINRSGRLLRSIDTDPGTDPANPPTSFLTPEFDMDTGAQPLGVVVDPAGRRAFVATDEGRIQKWDIVLGSDTFHQQVGEIDTGRAGLRQAMAVDRAGERLLALTSGRLLVFDLVTDALLADLAVGSDPRDVSVVPQGTQAFVTDSDGRISVVSLQTLEVLQTIEADASLRGMAMSPTGGLGYAADRRDDELAVVDLRDGEASFRTVVADLGVGADPVDVVVAPDGQRTFSVHEGSKTLEVLGIGFGPTLSTPFPPFAKQGDIVAYGAENIAAYDSTQAVTTLTFMDYAGERVALRDIGATANSVWSRVPSTFTGGAIRVGIIGPAILGQPDTFYSNPSFLSLFTAADIEATAERLSFARTFGSEAELDWQDQPIDWSTTIVHPRGDFMLVGVGNFVDAVGLDDTRADFLKSRGRFENSDGRFGLYRAFTPDGKLLYTQGANIVRYFDMDPASPTYGTELGRVDFSSIESQEYIEAAGDLGPIAVSPDGSQLMVYVGLTGTLYRVPLHGPLANTAVESTTSSLGRPRALYFHPAGEWLYSVPLDQESLDVVNLDDAFEGYLGVSSFFFETLVQDVAVSPDGQRMFAITRVGGLGGQWDILALDLGNAGSPQPIWSQAIEIGSPTDVASIRLHPNGMRAVVTIPERRIAYIDVQPAYRSPGAVDFVFEEIADVTSLGLFTNRAEFTPDGRRLLVSEQTNTVVEIYDYATSGGPKLITEGGFEQTGVAGTTLPAPLRLRAIGAGNAGVPDVIVEVRVEAGGGTIDGGVTSRNYVTDANGVVEIRWTLGPDPDPVPGVSTNRLSAFGLNSLYLSNPLSVVSPESIPLQLVQVLPAEGSLDVGVTTSVQAVFSRAIARPTVDAASVVLRRASNGATVPAVIGFADLDRRVTLLPLAPLAYASVYTFEIAATIEDLDGNPLPSGVVATFVTRAAPPPALTAISAPAATVGTLVTLVGAGFDPDRNNNVVNFNGKTYTPSTAAVDQLRFTVPSGAVDGPLSVTVGALTTSALPFTVLVPVTDPLEEISANIDLGLVTQGLAVLPDGSRGYSVVRDADSVIPLDLVALTQGTPIEVGDQPVAAVAAPTGDRVYVANFGDPSVSVIDTAVDQVTATIGLPAAPIALVVSPDGTRVFAITPADSSVHLIDSDTSSATFNTVVTSIPTGRNISTAAVSPDGTRLYLGTDDGFLVVGLTTSDFGVVTSIPTGRNISTAAVSPDGGLLILITDGGEIQIVDVSPGSSFGVVTSIPTGRNISTAAVSPDGGLLYLLEEGTDQVVVYTIDESGAVSALDSGAVLRQVTLTEIARFDAGEDPLWIAFDPIDPRVVLVGASGDRSINVIGRERPPVEECAPFPVTFGESWDGIALQTILDTEYGPGAIDALTDYEGYRCGDAVVPYWLDDAVDAWIVREIAGAARANILGWYTEDFSAPVIDGVEDGVIFQGGDGEGAVRFVDLGGSRRFGLYLNPNGALDAVNAPEPELFFANRAHNDVGPNGSGALHPPLTGGDPQALIYNVTHLRRGVPTYVVAWEDIDSGSPLSPRWQTGYGDNDYNDLVIEIQANSPVSAVMVTSLALTSRADGVQVSWTLEGAPGADRFVVERRDGDGDFREIATLEGASAVEEWVDTSITQSGVYTYRVSAILGSFRVTSEEKVVEFSTPVVRETRLLRARPNPFNPITTIEYALERKGPVEVRIYNLAGRLLRTIDLGEQSAGLWEVKWHGEDDDGRGVASGVYLVRLVTETKQDAMRVILLK